MQPRGPKLLTADNARPGQPGLIRRAEVAPTSRLTEAARAEFDRLVGVLESKGVLDRVDLAVATEAARVKALLDRAYRKADVSDPRTTRVVTSLIQQRRGLLRELGLTLQPSRNVVRTNPVPAEEDPLAARIKLSG